MVSRCKYFPLPSVMILLMHAQYTLRHIRTGTVPEGKWLKHGSMSGPRTPRSGSFDDDQCDCGSRGPLHRSGPLLSLAGIANWLPKVNIYISTRFLTVHSECAIIRSDTLINKLVSVHISGVIFGEKRTPCRSSSASAQVFWLGQFRD